MDVVLGAEAGEVGLHLNGLLAGAGIAALDAAVIAQFEAYLGLLLRWNAKVNLTAIRDAEGILRRHFVESIACARALPVRKGSLLDLGSGAGFPGIPIALCRPEMQVTVAESQGKKAAFLREVVRTLGIGARVHSGRAEALSEKFDCVTLRAVDRMQSAVRVGAGLVEDGGWLVLLCTEESKAAVEAAAGPGFQWADTVPLPGGGQRVLCMGQRSLAG